MSSSGASLLVYEKAINAVYISSIFLRHLIESVQGDNIQLYLSLEDNDDVRKDVLRDQTIANLVTRNVLNFIASVEVSSDTFLLHLELLNFMITATSTQLLCGPSPGPNDVNPFLDAAMAQDSSLVSSVVCRLVLNFMTRSNVPFNRESYSIFYDENQSSVLQRVGSAAANIVLFPFSYLVSLGGERSKSPIADISIHVLLVLVHYHKCVVSEDYKNNKSSTSDSLLKESPHFSDNLYCNALQNAIDCELDHVDIEGHARSARHIKLPFASLFVTLGIFVTSVLHSPCF